MDNDNIFWLNNPIILIKNYLNFIPTTNMNEIQIYNALTRLCIYIIILILVFSKSKYYIYLFVAIIIILILMNFIKHKNNDNSINHINKELEEVNSTLSNKESFDNIDYQFDLNDNKNIIRRNEFAEDTKNINNLDKDVQVGYYDSDDKIQFYRTTGKIDNENNEANLKYSCRKPTDNNPFMNPDINDYTNDNPPVECNEDDENIPENITKTFNKDLFMNLEDVFEIKNSQRQFYTVPNVEVPNKQIEFANWLYKSPETCKEDQEQCLRYEDLRFKR